MWIINQKKTTLLGTGINENHFKMKNGYNIRKQRNKQTFENEERGQHFQSLLSTKEIQLWNLQNLKFE